MKFEEIKVGETYMTTGKNEVKVLYKHEEKRILFVEFGEGKLLTFSREFEIIDWKPKQTLANNMWVKYENEAKVFITDLEKGYGFGVDSDGNWYGTSPVWSFRSSDPCDKWQPMTEEEVVEFMLEEANKRGYVDGVEVECLYDGAKEELDTCVNQKRLLFRYGVLWWDTKKGSDTLIMQNGKWAEIQPDKLTEKIKELQELASEQGKRVVVTIENK